MSEQVEVTKERIMCFVNSRWSTGDVSVVAIDSEGHVLASHSSSTVNFAKHDIGITSDWKHDRYQEAFPDGYDLVWLDDPLSDEGFQYAKQQIERRNNEAEPSTK